MGTWVKVDDKLPSNLKVRSVTVPARWAYIASICYAGANRTDGYIPESALALIDGSPKIAGELVTAGLWETAQGGWSVHDFLVYNRSREAQQSVEQKRSKAGSISAAKRQQRVLSPSYSVPDPVPSTSNHLGEYEREIGTNGQQSVEQPGFRDRYGTLVTALGGHLERRDADGFQQIAEDHSLDDITAAIRACRQDNVRPWPSEVRKRIPQRRSVEFDMEAFYEPA